MSLKDLVGENIAFIAKNPLYAGTTTFLKNGKIANIINTDEMNIMFNDTKFTHDDFRKYLLHIEEPNELFLEGMRMLLKHVKAKPYDPLNRFVRKWFKEGKYSTTKIMTGVIPSGSLWNSKYC